MRTAPPSTFGTNDSGQSSQMSRYKWRNTHSHMQISSPLLSIFAPSRSVGHSNRSDAEGVFCLLQYRYPNVRHSGGESPYQFCSLKVNGLIAKLVRGIRVEDNLGVAFNFHLGTRVLARRRSCRHVGEEYILRSVGGVLDYEACIPVLREL